MPASDTKWDIYLPTAGLIIGWINVGICVLEFMYIVFLISTLPLDDTHRDARHADDAKLLAYSLLSIYLVFIFIDFISSLMLIIGIDQTKSSLMLPWMILNFISIAMKLVSNLYLLMMWLVTLTPPLNNMGYFFFNLIYTAFHIWLWLLIYYLYIHIVSIE